jgi:hypothetical protein
MQREMHWAPLLNKVKKVSFNTEIMVNGSMSLMLSEAQSLMNIFTILTKQTLLTLLEYFQRTELNGQLLMLPVYCTS